MFKKLKGFLLSVRNIAKVVEKVAKMVVVVIDVIVNENSYATA